MHLCGARHARSRVFRAARLHDRASPVERNSRRRKSWKTHVSEARYAIIVNLTEIPVAFLCCFTVPCPCYVSLSAIRRWTAYWFFAVPQKRRLPCFPATFDACARVCALLVNRMDDFDASPPCRRPSSAASTVMIANFTFPIAFQGHSRNAFLT